MDINNTSPKYDKVSNKNVKELYSHNVQIYLDIPTGNLDLCVLEELALKRLYLFKLIENSSKTGYKPYSNEWTKNVMENLEKHKHTFYKLCKQSAELNDSSEEELEIRKMDYISHYILRICYLSSRKLYEWFIERELEWLYLRYQVQNLQSQQLFLELNHINYPKVNDREKKEISKSISGYQNEIYKIDFTKAIELIKYREVYLKDSYAYVPFQDLIWCVLVHYRSYLKKVLLNTCKQICLLDDNYIFFVKHIKYIINKEIMTINHDTNEGDYNLEITFSDLRRYSRQNFPLCIKLIYDRLKEVHHLKYGSRLQLGNFLKAIGLSLEDSLKFWNYELTHKMTQTHFEKNYSYYIKHMYGKVGQKKEYLPDTCGFITSMIIGVNETHGCPFKMWDMLHLTSKLKQLKISQSIIDEITDAVSCKQYQKACSKYFKAVHGASHDVNINSPLEYFNESRTILKPKVEEYETDSDDESQNENDEL